MDQKNTPKPDVEALRLFEDGMAAWKAGDRARAMSLYARSASLDPAGPGAEALRMTRDIMDFYDKNQFNP